MNTSTTRATNSTASLTGKSTAELFTLVSQLPLTSAATAARAELKRRNLDPYDVEPRAGLCRQWKGGR